MPIIAAASLAIVLLLVRALSGRRKPARPASDEEVDEALDREYRRRRRRADEARAGRYLGGSGWSL